MSLRIEGYTEGNPFQGFEVRYEKEAPFLEQTTSWKAGMRYRYSPESYPLSPRQLETLIRVGQSMGQLLSKKFPSYQIVEFRIDYVASSSGKLFITEVQTDDRGLPAVAIARNARGLEQSETLTGVAEPFINALKVSANKSDPVLLITYPESEYFYYAGFFDLAKMCWAYNQNVEVLPTSRELVSPDYSGNVRVKVPQEGASIVIEPDLQWDFSGSSIPTITQIQPAIDKRLLLEISKNTQVTAELKGSVPFTTWANTPIVINNKDRWVLKPISGKWSRGVIFGNKISQERWEGVIAQNNNLVAQEFIDPKVELFYVRDKKGGYAKEWMYSRVEGYYCLTGNGGWKLADVLATCTPEIPVHGKRDCIMIPGRAASELC